MRGERELLSMMWKPKKAKPTIVRTPLPSQAGEEKLLKDPKSNPFLRAENEDDDGYDPYSDRREEAPLFESSPWD